MPVDYSKWDALELSDDSDVEVHPNVDKKSFIRAKQNQIHQERLERKMRIDGLDYQRRLHEGLFQRVTSLLSILKGGLTDEEKAEDEKDSGKGLAKCAFRAVMESAGGFADDKLPKLPDGIEVDDNRPVSYSQMMAGLLDQVNKTLDEKQPEDRYTAMLEEVESHETQIMELIEDARAQMIALQSVDSKKITSEGIHVGFDSSHVNKSTSATGGDSTQVELLNPNFDTSGAAASKDDKGKGAAQEGGNEDEDTEASPLAKEFGKIKASDYAASLQFLGKHSEIISEKETDGLLILAFDAALEKDDDASRQYVHQALLLQYCRALGRDGVALFFKRITTKNHQAQGVFYRDVQDTYMRIKNRSREIIAERAKEGEGVEQIQLHAVEPGTVINIRVPPVESEDADEQEARKIFEAFSPEMRTALETGELDEVNKVLGALSIDEAEELVNWFGEANILSLEEQIIDATTDEGQQKLKELEKQAAEETKELEKQAAEEAKEGKVEEIGDPA